MCQSKRGRPTNCRDSTARGVEGGVLGGRFSDKAWLGGMPGQGQRGGVAPRQVMGIRVGCELVQR